jgi:hypothetical protein
MTKYILIFSTLFYLINGACTHKSRQHSEKTKQKIQPKEFVQKLENLGYFRMTTENELDSSKTYLLSMYKDYQLFDGKSFHNSLYNVDYRFYVLDGEELYEEDGLTTYLDDVKRTLTKLGVTLNYEKEYVRITGDSLYHTIRLNGTEYVAYSGVYDEYSWCMAAYHFANMINTELEKQKSNERIYLINSGNDGRLVFLSPKIYRFVQSKLPKDDERPMEPKEWLSYNGIN